MIENSRNDRPSFWQAIWQSLIEDQKDALRIARAGAIVGALLGAAAGIYLFEHLGWMGIGFGLIAGAVVGGIGLWLMHQIA